jgi:hypothetical protein
VFNLVTADVEPTPVNVTLFYNEWLAEPLSDERKFVFPCDGSVGNYRFLGVVLCLAFKRFLETNVGYWGVELAASVAYMDSAKPGGEGRNSRACKDVCYPVDASLLLLPRP